MRKALKTHFLCDLCGKDDFRKRSIDSINDELNRNLTDVSNPQEEMKEKKAKPAKRTPRQKKNYPTATPPTQSEIVLRANDNQEKPVQPQLNTGT